jgi:hypothetical protein
MQLNEIGVPTDSMDAMISMRGVEDLEAEMNADADAAGDLEAYDIRGLGEEYGDGNYYDEDVEEEGEDGFGYE